MSEFDLEIRQLEFVDEKIRLRLEGLDRDRLLMRPGEQTNPILWILGHMTTGRGYLLSWVGGDGAPSVDEREEELFGIGCRLQDGDPYPETDHLLDLMDQRGRALAERLRSIPPEDAAGELEFDLPFGNTVRAAVEFMLFHEAMHFGQLSYLCGWQGNPLGV
ncbi:MAG: DinB family protein [Planctomycetota bacterium]